jgi:hypothetical protein
VLGACCPYDGSCCLLFLRGVAPRADANDPDSGEIVAGISTNDIYLGVRDRG